MRADIKQFGSYHPFLVRLLLWLEAETGLEFTITSPHRIDDSGVHGTLPLRAVDLRCRSREVGEVIAKLINDHWKYDHIRPVMECAVLHGVGYNLHLHIQVHANTK